MPLWLLVLGAVASLVGITYSTVKFWRQVHAERAEDLFQRGELTEALREARKSRGWMLSEKVVNAMRSQVPNFFNKLEKGEPIEEEEAEKISSYLRELDKVDVSFYFELVEYAREKRNSVILENIAKVMKSDAWRTKLLEEVRRLRGEIP